MKTFLSIIIVVLVIAGSIFIPYYVGLLIGYMDRGENVYRVAELLLWLGGAMVCIVSFCVGFLLWVLTEWLKQSEFVENMEKSIHGVGDVIKEKQKKRKRTEKQDGMLSVSYDRTMEGMLSKGE